MEREREHKPTTRKGQRRKQNIYGKEEKKNRKKSWPNLVNDNFYGNYDLWPCASN